MISIQGNKVSGGIAIGRICFYRREEKLRQRRTVKDPEAEWSRFKKAQREAVRQLSELAAKAGKEAGSEAAALLEAHQQLVTDVSFEEAVSERIRKEGVCAEWAVQEACEQFAAIFAAMEDEYLKARGADLYDAADLLTGILSEDTEEVCPAETAMNGAAENRPGQRSTVPLPAAENETSEGRPEQGSPRKLPAAENENETAENRPEHRFPGLLRAAADERAENAEIREEEAEPILLASDDLSPSQTIRLDKRKVRCFLLRGGSAAGHTAILARSMGIPAIIGLGDQLKPEFEGRLAIADGETGKVLICPDEETVLLYRKKAEELSERRKELEKLKGMPTVTKDGRQIRLYCNISSPEDLEKALANDAEGIGLFRSEFLYLEGDDYPSEEEQFEAYRKVLAGMQGREVVIRTMDIGADKQVPYFDLPQEKNPTMGFRAIRICLTRPEIFRTQLRALYRASAYGRLKILLPMITSVWEVQETRELCRQVQEELRQEGRPFCENVPIGVMVETPAAALISDLLAKEADFFSCGTNDLTQFTLACDRESRDPGRVFDPRHPAVLRLLRMAVDHAHEKGIPFGICGELGADPKMTGLFLSLGVDELSVNPEQVLPLRKRIREMDSGLKKPEKAE